MGVCGCRVSDVAGGVAEALADGTGRSEVWTLGGPVDGMDRRCRNGPGKKAREARRCRVYCSGPACLLAGCSAEQHARERDFLRPGAVMEACDAREARGLEVVSEFVTRERVVQDGVGFRAEGGGWNGKWGRRRLPV